MPVPGAVVVWWLETQSGHLGGVWCPCPYCKRALAVVLGAEFRRLVESGPLP
jgi:hypothetical protein